eukprot:2087164-Prymnesium_polylepis.1
MHGVGKFTCPKLMRFHDHGVYDGPWWLDVRGGQRGTTGQATFTLPNGDVYHGTWCHDRRNGQGTYTRHDNGAVWHGNCTQDYPTFDEMRATAAIVP